MPNEALLFLLWKKKKKARIKHQNQPVYSAIPLVYKHLRLATG